MRHAFSGVKKSSHLLLIGMLLVLMPTMAEAVGLGRLKVNSALNEPLNAEIPLTSVTRREVRSLAAGLAPFSAFKALGIERPRHLLGVKFTVAKRLDGRYFLQLTTRSAYQEPFLHMLVQVEWAGGRLRREYTALIDPPYLSSARPSSITAPRLQSPQEDYEPLPDPIADEVLKESAKPMAKSEEVGKKLPEPVETLPEPLPEEPQLVNRPAPDKPAAKVAETAPALPEPISDDGSSEGKSIDQIEEEAFGAGGLNSPAAKEPEIIFAEPSESLPEPITQTSQAESEMFEPYDRGEGLLGPSHIPIIPIIPVEVEPVQMTPAFWAAAAQYKVKRGDTLFEIARRLRKDNSVTMNQAMMAIYDANPRAFYGKNVNNLRAGKILNVPERDIVSSRSVRASNQLFKVQYDSWQEHKLKLAQSREPMEVASQPIEQAPAPVAVAKADKSERNAKLKAQREAKKKSAAKAKAIQLASEKEQQQRQAQLKAKSDAKNKKLADASKAADARKAKDLADKEAAKKAKAKAEIKTKIAKTPAVRKSAPKPSKTAKAKQTEDLLQIVRASMLMTQTEPGLTAETESLQAEKERQMLAKRMSNLEESIESKKLKNKEISDKVGKVKKNIESQKRLIDIENPTLAKTTPKKAAEPVKTKQPVTPVVKKAVQKKPLKVAKAKKPAKRRPTPKAAPKEASVVDTVVNTLLGNQFMLMLIGGMILLGAAIFAIYMKRRRKTIADFEESILSADTTTDDISTDSQEDIGESGDTSFLSDFSQEGMGNIATDEVDPIAEADVYLAYGRDEQAEEILKDAISKHPDRAELKLKLLEIYHQRSDISGFETLAEELYASGGASEVWSQVADMGGQLNPENPMFKGDAPPAGMIGGAEPEATGGGLDMTEMAPGNAVLDDSTGMDDSLDFDIDAPAAGGATEIVSAPTDDGLDMNADIGMDLDMDMDMGSTPAAEEAPAMADSSGGEDFALDFSMDTADVGGDDSEEVAAEPAPVSDDNALDFSMDLEDMGLEAEGDAVVSEDAVASDDDGINMDDMSLDMGTDDADMGLDLSDDGEDDSLSFDTSDDSDLDLSSMEVDEPEETASALDLVKADGGGLSENDDGSLDFSLDSGSDSDLDLSGDFGADDGGDVEVAEAVDVAEAVGTAAADVDGDENWDEAATKLDLAKAYIDMGDADGAKSILDEVMSEGNDEQKAQASELAAQI